MSGYGYPHNNPYGAGPPPNQPYGAPPPTAQPYGAPPPTAHPYGSPQPSSGSGYPAHDPYGKPQKDNYSSYPAPHDPYGKPDKPPKDNYSGYPTAPHDPYGKPDKPSKDNYSGYPTHDPYGKPDNKPQKDNYSGYPTHDPYGKPQKDNYGQGYPSAPPPPHGGSGSGSGYPSAPPQGGGVQGYGAFAALMPSTFAPGTDPTIIACFQVADQDGSGVIDDKELQRALSGYNQSFSLHTVHLLMLNFTSSNSRKIGPKEFTALFYALQSWREIFERFDKDRSGRIDAPELRDALYSLGFAVSPVILDLLVSKFDKSGGKNKAIEYDNFIECCLTVKGLTEKFKEKDTQYRGSATFTYEEFMLTVLPYLVA